MPDISTTLRVPNYAGAPGSPKTGQLYYDTGTNTLFFWNGAAWRICDASAVTPVATGGTGQTTALAARGPSGLNVESRTTFSNANYTILATDNYIATTTTAFTATRTVTLPAANSLNAGERLYIGDDGGAINGAFFLTIARAGTDTIHGGTASIVLDMIRASIILESDGTSNWTTVSRSPAVRMSAFTTSGTYTPPVGVKALLVECVGGGGGGGGAVATASNATAGSGGGGGGYATKFLGGSLAGGAITALKTSYSYVIGVAGTAGAATGTNGVVGGDTTFDSASVCTATGGAPGVGSAVGATTPGAVNLGGAGGSPTVGDFGFIGSCGSPALRFSGTAAAGGNGGVSGGVAGATGRGGIAGAGTAGGTYGGGGGGAVSVSATGAAGGAGSAGFIRITEYF